ncbi:predicted protein [Pyrenophora tritici-repentis Pt-1C-BFP]|uniref:Uncharacterized protein n=1 Tax=Pyrenophora tritici-repentis (strain Pt-1C-BFP) TaxID=426418 RepID=B2WAK2_PYRTR|nr:uncharacterized protein PTRG_07315 [Pyrenophora tritici-repentis Pt-1C-BFP]EDU50234.1 predicted protein [Pyrenophora tritici-repentis Pt-1C-BFP]
MCAEGIGRTGSVEAKTQYDCKQRSGAKAEASMINLGRSRSTPPSYCSDGVLPVSASIETPGWTPARITAIFGEKHGGISVEIWVRGI